MQLLINLDSHHTDISHLITTLEHVPFTLRFEEVKTTPQITTTGFSNLLITHRSSSITNGK